MRKQKAIISYSEVKDNDLTEVAELVIAKLTGNADFPNPPVTLADMRAAKDAYALALVKAKDGTKQDTADKNAKRLVLEGMLADNAGYVNERADGNLVMLQGSGLPISKVPEPVGILPAPEKFVVSEGGDPGQVKIEIGVVERATGYIVLYAVNPPPPNDAQWMSKTFSKTSGIITGLTSGTKMVFKAAATSPEANKIGLYNFTEPVEKFVQ